MSLQFDVDEIGTADQINAEAEIASSGERAFDGPRRRVIPTHGINSDAQANLCALETLSLCDLCGYSSSTGRTWRAR